MSHTTTGNRNIAPRRVDFDELRQKIADADDYDHHNILRRKKKIGWSEWHLNIAGNNNAIKIAQQFHHDKRKLKLSLNVNDAVDTIKEMVSKLPLTNQEQRLIASWFKEARDSRSLLPIIKVYTKLQGFSTRLNKHLAANTHHALEFYCTPLNCPILARTQEYTETFTSILFHPDFENYIVRQKTVHRGAVLKDKKFLQDYKEGATIITTTVLSTSRDYGVAEMFAERSLPDQLSVIFTYNINNTKRRTALDLGELSCHRDEEEILILPYVPFTIKSIEQMDNGQKMRIYLDECNDC